MGDRGAGQRRVVLSCILAISLFIPSAQAVETRKAVLPLGDGRISFKPVAGFIFVCSANFAAGGAFRDGSWISGQQWYPDGKVTVGGMVGWPEAQIRVALQGDERVISGNGLPVNQKTGHYPVSRDDPAFAYDRNPYSILEQSIHLWLPAAPKPAASPRCLGAGMVGMTVSGVAIFSGLDAMGRDAGAHEIQDHCLGHPAVRGQYHYHGWSPCIPDAAGEAGQHSELSGYMLDGFGIYGPRGEGGKRLSNADLDVCHGHSHTVLWDGQMVTMYHYHFTDEYPYTIGCFKGQPTSISQAEANEKRPAPGKDTPLRTLSAH